MGACCQASHIDTEEPLPKIKVVYKKKSCLKQNIHFLYSIKASPTLRLFSNFITEAIFFS